MIKKRNKWGKMISEQSRFVGTVSRALIVITLLVGSLLFPESIAADTWLEVSDVINGGYEYLNVRIDYDPDLPDKGLLLTRDEGSTINVAVSDIFMIVDKSGKKITELVLRTTDAEPYQEYQPKERSTESTDASELKAMIDSRSRSKKGSPEYGIYESRFRLAVSGGVGYGAVAGDWFEGLTNGMDLNGNVRLMVFDDYYMGFGFRRQELGVDNDLLGTYMVCDEFYNCFYMDVLEMNVHLNEYSFVVGRITRPYTLRSPVGFIEIGFGGITHVFDITVSDGDDTINEDSSETKFAMFMAGGS